MVALILFMDEIKDTNSFKEGDIVAILDSILDAFTALEQVGNESSTNGKQEILKQHEGNEVLKTLLFSAYSPFIQYNIKKIPTVTSRVSEPTEDNYSDFLELLVQLSKREITGNAAIDALTDFFEGCTQEEFTWYSRVIGKDMRIGLADKGINKVYKGLIPVYDVLLADKIPADGLNLDNPKVLKMLPERIITQYKIDGYRLNIFVFGDSVEIRTRNGKYVQGYNDLEDEALRMLPAGYVYDGEMVSPELFNWIESNMASTESQAPNRDLFSEAMSHAFSNEDNKDGIFNMFDMVPISEWTSRKTTETLETRTKRIHELVMPLNLKHIRVVPTSRVYYKNNPEDMQEIVETFHYYLSIGWEGLMIKNWDAKYEFKRSKNLLKMKLMDTIDLEVIELFEGEGKYKGMMGGAIVDYKGYRVGVGSGWKDEEREYYWGNKNELVGKTIEIAYQAETKNKEGGLSLSFPVVKSIRYDK